MIPLSLSETLILMAIAALLVGFLWWLNLDR